MSPRLRLNWLTEFPIILSCHFLFVSTIELSWLHQMEKQKENIAKRKKTKTQKESIQSERDEKVSELLVQFFYHTMLPHLHNEQGKREANMVYYTPEKRITWYFSALFVQLKRNRRNESKTFRFYSRPSLLSLLQLKLRQPNLNHILWHCFIWYTWMRMWTFLFASPLFYVLHSACICSSKLLPCIKLTIRTDYPFEWDETILILPTSCSEPFCVAICARLSLRNRVLGEWRQCNGEWIRWWMEHEIN